MIHRLRKNQKLNKFLVRSLILTLLIPGSIFFIIFSPSLTSAASNINQEINYQGKLTNSSNVAVADGSYNMEFKLYTVSSGGVAIWTEDDTGASKVTVSGGLFSVMLGSTTPFTNINFNQTLYLGVNIGGSGSCGGGFACGDGEMAPRKIIGSVPAAIEAYDLGGASSTQYLRSDTNDSLTASTTQTALAITQIGSGNILSVGNNSSTFFNVNNNGFVGVGTTTPTSLFSVGGNALFTGLTTVSGAGTSTFTNNLSVGGTLAAGNISMTSFTQGSVLFASSTGLFSQDNSNLFYDDNNHFLSVGIGGTTASATLDVSLPSSGNNPGLRLRQSNIPTSRYWDESLSNNAGTVALQYSVYNSGTTYYPFFISQTGQLGTGQWGGLSPSQISNLTNFNIITPSGITSAYQGMVITDNATPRLRIEVTTSNTPQASSDAVQIDHLGTNGDLGLASRQSAASNIRFFTSNGTTLAEVGRFDSSGRFAVGSTTPYAKLTVEGTSGSTDNIFAVASSSNAQLLSVSSNGHVGVGTSSPISDFTVQGVSGSTDQLFEIASSSGASYFHVRSNGNVGIGSSTPSANLSVQGVSGNSSALLVVASSSATLAPYLDIQANGQIGIGTSTPQAGLTVVGSGSLNPFTIASSTGATLMTILANGNVGIGTTTPSAALQVAGNVLVGAAPNSSQDWTRKNSAAGKYQTTTSIGTTTVSAVFNGSLYVGTGGSTTNAAEIYRYNNDGTWTQLNPGAVAGSFGSETNVDSVSAMMVFQGSLFIGTSEPNAARVYRYDGGTTWTAITPAVGRFVTNASIDSVSSMTVNNGYLYIGVSEPAKAEVYRYEGGATSTTWTDLNSTAGTFGGTASFDNINNLLSYEGRLYVSASKNAGNAAQIFRYDGGVTSATAWTALNATAGTFQTTTLIDSVSSMQVYNGTMYIGTAEPGKAEVYRYDSSQSTSTPTGFNSWTVVSSSTAPGQIASSTASGSSAIDGVVSMSLYNGNLYVGTRKANAAEIYKLNSVGTWMRVSSSTAGVIPVSTAPTTAIDTVTALQPYNNKLYAFTAEPNSTEAYEYQSVQDQSYSLQFNAQSATGTSAVLNTASITFFADEQGFNDNGTANNGRFYFSNGINTSFGAYDVAEDYPTRDTSLEPGDLVSIDTSEQLFVKKSAGIYDNNIVGVYSSNPALELSQADATINGGTAIPIALAGRVPVKVALDNGPIAIGDYLTVGPEPGTAVKAINPGRVIGRALSAYDGSAGETPTVTVFLGFGSITAQDLVKLVPVDPNATSTDQSLASSTPSTASSTGLVADDSGLALLTTFLNAPAATATVPVTEVTADRVAAGLDIISPRVLTKGLVVDSISALDKQIAFSNDVIFFGRPYFNSDTAGFALISAGARSVDVVFDNPYLDQPIVNASISFEDASSSVSTSTIAEDAFFATGIQYVITRKSEIGFTILLNKAAPEDIKFSWIALAVQSAKTFASRPDSDIASEGNATSTEIDPNSQTANAGGPLPPIVDPNATSSDATGTSTIDASSSTIGIITPAPLPPTIDPTASSSSDQDSLPGGGSDSPPTPLPTPIPDPIIAPADNGGGSSGDDSGSVAAPPPAPVPAPADDSGAGATGS